ncbi:hypothetical protein J2T17_002154 [Paenibacillus mucilaginosus]|uniref:hypothetical protein n=1 Tax=Paenibacillus mucilaginosus TaxID=61624 RepID=UPI003D21C947
MIIKPKSSISSSGLLSLILPLKENNYWPEEIVQEMILAEYLRNIIYMLSVGNNYSLTRFSPVYIRTIINTLRKHLDTVWPLPQRLEIFSTNNDEDRGYPLSTDSIKWTLNLLQMIGDIVHVGNGYWLPSPLRFIELPESDEIGVVGGWPTRNLAREYGAVMHLGLGRMVIKGDIKRATFDPTYQSYEAWRGWVPANILGWAEALVKRARDYGSNSSSNYLDYEVFISFKAKRNYRSAWVGIENINDEDLQKNILLCRTRAKPVIHFLGVFQKGKLIKELGLEGFQVAWLRLGLRQLHGVPLTAKWEGNLLKPYPSLPSSIEQELLFYMVKVQTPNFPAYFVHEGTKAKVEALLDRYGYKFNNKGEKASVR